MLVCNEEALLVNGIYILLTFFDFSLRIYFHLLFVFWPVCLVLNFLWVYPKLIFFKRLSVAACCLQRGC